jgi:hypothetical protein
MAYTKAETWRTFESETCQSVVCLCGGTYVHKYGSRTVKTQPYLLWL